MYFLQKQKEKEKEIIFSSQFCYTANTDILLQSYSHYLEHKINFTRISLNVHCIENVLNKSFRSYSQSFVRVLGPSSHTASLMPSVTDMYEHSCLQLLTSMRSK